MSALDKDVRYGIRALRRSPGFALVALVSLALGIGANTTIFSVANAVLYRPVPFQHPDRLVVIHEQNTKREGWQRRPSLSTMIEWQQQARSFEQIEGIVWYAEANTLSGDGAAERVTIQFLTPGAFSLLGVKPARGRVFTREDAVPGNRSLIISDGLWQRRFGGARDALGRTLQYGGRPGTIVGVMPPGAWTTPWMQNIETAKARSGSPWSTRRWRGTFSPMPIRSTSCCISGSERTPVWGATMSNPG